MSVDPSLEPWEKVSAAIGYAMFDDDEDDVPYFTRFHGYAAPSDSEMYDDTGEVITELLEITAPEALFNDVVSALPEHGWISQDPFVATLDDELNIKWKHFAEMVKHKQRFTFLANKEFEGLPSKYDNGLFDILTELGSLIHRFNICKDLDMSAASVTTCASYSNAEEKEEIKEMRGHTVSHSFYIKPRVSNLKGHLLPEAADAVGRN